MHAKSGVKYSSTPPTQVEAQLSPFIPCFRGQRYTVATSSVCSQCYSNSDIFRYSTLNSVHAHIVYCVASSSAFCCSLDRSYVHLFQCRHGEKWCFLCRLRLTFSIDMAAPVKNNTHVSAHAY